MNAPGRTRSSRATILLALAVRAQGETTLAVEVLAGALAVAEPEGFVRIFIDEGAPMGGLLLEALARGFRPAYVRQLLAAFPTDAAGRVAPLRFRRRPPRGSVWPSPSAGGSSRCPPHRRRG